VSGRRSRWLWEVRDAAGVLLKPGEAKRLSVAIMLRQAPSDRLARGQRCPCNPGELVKCDSRNTADFNLESVSISVCFATARVGPSAAVDLGTW
jgi:hypothetical protein